MTDEELNAYRRLSGQRIRIKLRALEPRLRAMSQEKARRRSIASPKRNGRRLNRLFAQD